MNQDEQAVGGVLDAYQEALNRSDTAAVMQLYAPDGVFMGEYSPSSVGTDAIRRAYDAVFGSITLSVKFNIAEIHQLAPDWVLARTTSAGTVKVKATDTALPEGNQELFLFQKVDAVWKMARYCFSSTNPPPGSPWESQPR
jgi:uncharacterized protein (TIGR02246 family)